MKEIVNDINQLPTDPATVRDVNTRDKDSNKIMREAIVALKEVIREKNLDGLAACQLGIDERIMVINFGKNDLRSYINPMLIKADGMIFNRETCVHIPDKQFLVPRYKDISLAYETPLGQFQQARFVGKAAYVVQHLIWHMDGLFIDEVGLEIDDDWDQLTDEEKTNIIKQYAESLDVASNELNDEVNKSEEGRKLKDAIEFEQAVRKGEVQIKEETVYMKKDIKEEIDEHNSVQEGNESTGE